jgi:glycine cleavage system H protein
LSEYLQTVFQKFELRVRKGYYYTEDGLWTSVEGPKVRVGVTDYLQRTRGDAAFVDLVKPGSTVQKQTGIGTLETAKTTVSLLSPISGTVEEVNGMLLEKPELVNSDPYGEGWLITLTPHSLEDDLKSLMSADDYFQLMLKKLETEHKKPESK